MADAQATRPGIWLVPMAVVLCLLATQEMLRMFRASGKSPLTWTIYVGNAFAITSCLCADRLARQILRRASRLPRRSTRAGLACGLAAGLLVALFGEMRQYTAPGQSIANLSAAALSILYVGGLLGFLVQLRLLDVAKDVQRGGLLAMLSMIIVVKMTDIGAYTAGRLWGRHKMAPTLSPGKTWEGVAGGLVFAMIGAWAALGPLASKLGVESSRSGILWLAGVFVYAMVVSWAGILGDLAESLIKRDAGVKDSSDWLPGFGGVLDLLDSLLVAAPVAYFCWISGLLK